MRRKQKQLRWWLLSGALLLVILVWSSRGSDAAGAIEARPPIPNPVAQRNKMIAEMKRLNQQMAELNRLLRSGSVVVTIS